MPINVGIIDAIQSRANAAFACGLERNGDSDVTVPWLVVVCFGEKKIEIRTMPNIISMIENNPRI